jgi:class 3 adenylate cyclase/tetratricopeptide (TPR) repeat protein
MDAGRDAAPLHEHLLTQGEWQNPMKCPKCQTENLADSSFCEECSAPLEAACPTCGAGNRPGAKFCRKCRAALGAAPAAAPEPRAYTPKHLADKILTARSALEGERKQVTVLFADVKGSMELASQVDPEEWHHILDRFFQILTEGVHRFEGTVNQYTGDGMMALFGAPIAHEDHARRACYAALHLLDGLRPYANELRLRRGLNFSARLGINSGEVVVGKIGDDLRMDYTAQGHTVGLAARMEQIAEPGKAYLTAHTAAEVQGYFALADLGALDVKGAQGPMQVYELQGLGQMRTRLDVSRSRGFSRFVGRGDEMHALESALARARDGTAQVVGIVGEAGLGKSRLCYEFLERCRAQGLMTYETAGVAHGKAIPFMPLLRLWRAFYGVTDQDSAATAREKIAGRLLLLDDRLRETLPLVFDFFGVPDPEMPLPRMDPEVRQRQSFDVVRRVVQARGRRETTITLLEDLHWFDGGSEAFLEPLIDATLGTRGLIILNFRPEYQAAWMGKSYYQQLPLSPLGADAIRELLDALLGNDPSIAGLAEAIHARTGGNPFYTEEVVQSLIESGKLQGGKGAYRLVTPVDRLEVPTSVHAILAARIDRLAEREKDVLQTAAVIGREFDEPTLAAVVEQDAPQLREALQMLKDTEFVYEQSLYPVAEYLFKHPLTQEVALASQLQERRKRLHAAVARVIEAAHAEDLDRQAALLAHHWEEAADPGQAVHWHRRAAEWAAQSDPVEGLRHWRKVRELGRALPDESSKEACLRACRAVLGGGSWRLGMSEDDVREILEEGRALARELGRPAAVANLLVGVAGHHGVLGRAQAALDMAEESAALVDDTLGRGEVIAVDVATAYWGLVAGRVPYALAVLDRILERTGGDPQAGREIVSFSPLVWADQVAGIALAQAGRFEECRSRTARALRLAREHAMQENLGWALGTPSVVAYFGRGAAGGAVPDLLRAAAEAVDIAAAVGTRYSQIAASSNLATASLMSGDFAACEDRMTDCLASARESGTGLDWHGQMLATLADARLARGNVDGAIAAAREGIAVADAGGAWFQAAVARAALVDALVRAGAPAHAVAPVVAEARELVRKSGGNSLLPRLREAEARLAGRDDRAALTAGLRDAASMYRAMGAPDPAERLAQETSG